MIKQTNKWSSLSSHIPAVMCALWLERIASSAKSSAFLSWINNDLRFNFCSLASIFDIRWVWQGVGIWRNSAWVGCHSFEMRGYGQHGHQ